MNSLKIPVRWDRPGDKGSTDAVIVGFSHSGGESTSRPVAVVVERETGRMTFVEFRYLTVDKWWINEGP